eukprot:COSAG02_NODE_288_length_25612_cov_29.808529_9_plen_375_part_00
MLPRSCLSISIEHRACIDIECTVEQTGRVRRAELCSRGRRGWPTTMGLSRGAITLLLAAALYCYASGAEVLLVKLMNAKPPRGAGVLLPLGTALLLNGYWPIQLLMYRFVWAKTASPRPLTWKHVRGYAIIGVMAAAVSGLRCVGINYMPGSVYVIISTADLPLNTMLSRLILKKEFTALQYMAVVCAMSGILVCLAKSGDDSDQDHPCDGDSCIDDWGKYILVCCALSSACVPVLSHACTALLSRARVWLCRPPSSLPSSRRATLSLASSCSRRTRRTRCLQCVKYRSSTRLYRSVPSLYSSSLHSGGKNATTRATLARRLTVSLATTKPAGRLKQHVRKTTGVSIQALLTRQVNTLTRATLTYGPGRSYTTT